MNLQKAEQASMRSPLTSFTHNKSCGSGTQHASPSNVDVLTEVRDGAVASLVDHLLDHPADTRVRPPGLAVRDGRVEDVVRGLSSRPRGESDRGNELCSMRIVQYVDSLAENVTAWTFAANDHLETQSWQERL